MGYGRKSYQCVCYRRSLVGGSWMMKCVSCRCVKSLLNWKSWQDSPEPEELREPLLRDEPDPPQLVELVEHKLEELRELSPQLVDLAG